MRKEGQLWGSLWEWLVALAVLVLALVIVGLYYGKGTSAIEFLKNLVRFR